LYLRPPNRGEARRATLWREQRLQLTELIKRVLAERFFEAPSEVEMIRIVTLAASSLRRSRHSVGLRELLRSPQEHADFLSEFVEKRVELKRLPGAPVPAWQAASDRGDRFREYRQKASGKSAIPLYVSSDEIVPAVHEHVVTKPPEVKVSHRYTHNRQPLTAEILLDAMTAWLYKEVTMKFNFTADVCEHARVQIGYGFLEQYRVKTAATSFNGLMEELRPTEFSDDAGIFISELAGWLLQCLLATGYKPEWMYWAFGAAGSRARQMEEKASYDKRAATLANGRQSDLLGA
jgi:hypothetical protein